jgi:predicted ATPase
MICSLTLRNCRAYHRQTFEFSKLNIFVGPNNSGKSSALSAINFLAQSVQQRDINSGPIALNGSFEELGTFLDVVHGNRANTPIGFDLTYAREQSVKHKISFEIKYRRQRKEAEIASFAFSQRGREIYSYKTQKDSFSVRVRKKKLETIVSVSGIQRRPRFLTIFPIDPAISPYGYAREDEAKKLSKQSRQLLQDVDQLMRDGRGAFQSAFGQFDSISSFRDQPQRTYLFTGETPSRVGRTGSNSVSLLVNDVSKRGSRSAGIMEAISRFFASTNIAKGIDLRPLTQRHFEICIRDLDNNRHNICDVGFGCSQVLPVLIGGLNAVARRGRLSVTPTFLVQEPEIHLHPNAQASLGSFFVSLAKNRSQLFIETHSDNLILRIATLAAAGAINPSDIAIFFCENRKGRKRVRRINLDAKGVFQPRWPGGFFPQREKESLALFRARRIQESRK